MDNGAVGVGHYENFPVASLLCPPTLRAPVRAIYAFARTADDIADEGTAPTAQRLADLAQFRHDLVAADGAQGSAGQTRWPNVFAPLALALREHGLSSSLLHDLLDAFEQDIRNPLYANRDELLDYCRRSANPIGRLLLQLYGVADARALRQSDALCTALQLINFWQDLSVDIARGRIYLPRDDARHHGIEPADPSTLRDSPAMRSLVRDLVQWAATMMAEGAALPPRITGRAGWELRFVVHGGWRVLEKIARMDFASMARRPRLHAVDLPLLAWRSARYTSRWFVPGRLA